MKFKATLFLLFSGFFFNSYAQETIELTFNNGETKEITIDYDNPAYLPKWGIDCKFFGLMSFNAEALSFKLSPHYKINKLWMLKANITMPYSKGVDGNVEESFNEENRKLAHDWSLMNHYILATKTKTQTKKTAVDYVDNIVYTASLPRIMEKNLSLDGGLGHIQYATNGRLKSLASDNNNGDTSFRVMDFSCLSFNLGASLYKVESYKITATSASRAYWRTSRLYGMLTFGLKTNYVVERTIYDGLSGSSSSFTYSQVTEGFEKPENKAMVGYRFGFEKNWGMLNSGNSMTLGLEIGSLPKLYSEGKPIGLANSIFMFHVGFGFGPKPKQLKQ